MNGLDLLPFADYADEDPNALPFADDDDTRPCDACGADLSEPCRPWCIGDALRGDWWEA